MKQSLWNGRELSRMMLGTVQFGMPYGVANRTGQPDYREVVQIVAAALEGGVNCFDTAAAYGTSEDVLGRVLAELKMSDQVLVVTKVKPLSPEELADGRLAQATITRSVDESRRRLKRDCLPLVLFHRECDARHASVLHELQAKGWIDQVGVSCDNVPGPASEFARSGQFTALQIPGNILDHRHCLGGSFDEAVSRGVVVFLRSVYLQGLLVMPEQDIPPHLSDVIPIRRRLESLAQAAGMGLAELSLRAMLSQTGVTSILTGVETLAQVRENLALFDRGPLPVDLQDAIRQSVPELNESIITPSRWPQLSGR